MAGDKQRPVDDVSGTETTGHEWDGIRELDTPLPRWWQWVFYGCIVWSIGYWIAMPAWPTLSGYTRGLIGYSSRAELETDVKEARAAQGELRERIVRASLEQIRSDPALLEFALVGGRSAYSVNCATCHGSGAAGGIGYPNLNDDEWLWGGNLEQIAFTIRHGVRNDVDDQARLSQMPAFLKDGILTRAEVDHVTEYVLALAGQPHDKMAAALAADLFKNNCASCHGERGEGMAEQGAPALNNDLWLYGGDRNTVHATIANARRGVMPAWGKLLDEVTIKQLAVYIHSLGGGK
jgi:cytochrome c oxidase cbb3-type subunit 3